MSNPFFKGSKSPASAPSSSPLALIAEFKRFAKNVTPQQAEAEINRLLSSGQMSQQEFEYLKGAAKQFINFLK